MELTELWNLGWNQVQAAINNNQFLSGGLTLGLLGGLIAYGRSLPRRLYSLFLYHWTIVLTMNSNDGGPRYRQFLHWMHEQPYAKKTRRVMLKSLYDVNNKQIFTLAPAKGNHFFIWKKRPLWLHVAEEGGGGGTVGAPSTSAADLMNRRDVVTIRMFGRDKELFNELFREVTDVYWAKQEKHDSISVLSPSSSSGWDEQRRTPRPLDSVYLPKDADNLVQEIKAFYKKEKWYKERGIPFRRGYLFHGPPGTGKSCSVEAIAGALGANIYVINLASVMTDSELEIRMRNMRPSYTSPNILLIEDIDTAAPDRDNKEGRQPFSLGTLLNCLDGFGANEHIVVVMTTNRKEALDPALIRPGRCDRMIEFGYAEEGQITQAIEKWFSDEETPASG